MAPGAGQLHADPATAPVIRLVLAGVALYALYAMGRRFVRSVPDDFEPAGIWPGDGGRGGGR